MLINMMLSDYMRISRILKVVIILCIVLLLINAILFIPVQVKFLKRKSQPLEIVISIFYNLFQKQIRQDDLKGNKKRQKKIDFISFLFSSNLNTNLSKLKEENFYIYVLLENAKVKKLTFIPTLASKNESIFSLLGFGSWLSIAYVKKVIESTFQIVDDDYYQVDMNNQETGLMFELELEVRLFQIVMAIFKKFKLFNKTIIQRGVKNE